MKKMKMILSVVLMSSSVFASDVLPVKETAKNAAIALSKVNWAHMDNRLTLQVLKVTEKNDSFVKVQLSIGSTLHPESSIKSCVSVSFDGLGNMTSITNDVNTNSCD
ncbi:MAG: hypothetical protein H7328_03660 [Bdellovibrio sp.]|nr:hypothetical protein [Bdellovibrio sp.]